MSDLDLLVVLEKRFEKNMHRHPDQKWNKVKELLNDNNLAVLRMMEETLGEPDVIVISGKVLYIDMSKESPKERRSLCYDKEARVNRKKFPPKSSVEEVAKLIGIKVVDEEMYLQLQEIEPLDQKSSSWIKTEESIRKLKGAIFGDRRFNRAFIFHNTADCYYKDRGFRGYLELS